MATAVIGTWAFSLNPVASCFAALTRSDDPLDAKVAAPETVSVSAAVADAIRSVELDPTVATVGSHSYPNVNGAIQLDAAIVEVSPGRHRCGAVMALEGYPGAIDAAFAVMESCQHRILVGSGAKAFLESEGFHPSVMPIPTAHERPVAVLPEREVAGRPPQPGDDHDTVGIIAVRNGVLTVGCSTSGKRAKLSGRVGDSPIFGSGLYAEPGVGGAVATGDGDKICSFPLTFSAVSLMRSGHSPQEACELALKYFFSLPQGDSTCEVAIVALNIDGQAGAACSPNYVDVFSFAFASSEVEPQLFGCRCD